MKKNLMKALVLGVVIGLLGACAKEDQVGQADEEMPVMDVESALKELREELNEGKDINLAEKVRTSKDGILNPNLAELTGGEIEVLYTNEKPVMLRDMDGFFVSIDKYQITKVSDVNSLNESIFKGETGGYVVTAHMTIENGRKTPVYYTNYASIYLEDRQDTVTGNAYYFVPREEVLQSDNPKEWDNYPPGFKKQGFQSFVMTEEQYKMMGEVQPKIIIPGGAKEEKEDYSRKYGNAVFDFAYSEENEEELAVAPAFYQDEIVNKNMGIKTMVYEKTGIGQILSLGDVKIEFEGVQYAEIEPLPAHVDEFYQFDEEDEIVALTVKFNVDNESDETLDLSAVYSALYDQNDKRYRTEGMLEPDTIQILEPGESGEKLHVFLLTWEELDQIESLNLAFGPFSSDGKRLFKGRDVIFKIPI